MYYWKKLFTILCRLLGVCGLFIFSAACFRISCTETGLLLPLPSSSDSESSLPCDSFDAVVLAVRDRSKLFGD